VTNVLFWVIVFIAVFDNYYFICRGRPEVYLGSNYNNNSYQEPESNNIAISGLLLLIRKLRTLVA